MTKYEGYIYPWKLLIASRLFFSTKDLSVKLSRALITDYDLQRKSEQRRNMEDDLSLLSLEHAEPQPKIPKNVWKDLPKKFGAVNNHSSKIFHKRKGSNWEDYWERTRCYFIYSTWLEDYGSDMNDEDKHNLIQAIESYPTDDLLYKTLPVQDIKNVAKSSPFYDSLITYEEIFQLHCEMVEKKVRQHYDLFCATECAQQCKKFIQEIAEYGFASGFTEKEFSREESGGAKFVKDDDIFYDVSYSLYDPHMNDIGLVLDEAASTETSLEEKVSDQPLVPPSHFTHPSSSTSFHFDPSTEQYLIAKNAFDIYKDDKEIRKYWFQRYRLFTKLDEGILMDREGWFSVTPERIAEHIADRVVRREGMTVVDGFAGVGGNSIQFALRGAHVIAIDMDPIRLKCARENARIYGVDDRISFICADFFSICNAWGDQQADAVFLSPPWGGPEYLKSQVFDLHSLCPDGFSIFAAASRVSPNIAYFLPRHSSVKQVISLAGEGGRCEMEQSSLNRKIKAITAYYGDLIA